jgi:hypothetical protein
MIPIFLALHTRREMHTISTEVNAKIQRPDRVLFGLQEQDACEHCRLSPMVGEHQPSRPMSVAGIAMPWYDLLDRGGLLRKNTLAS